MGRSTTYTCDRCHKTAVGEVGHKFLKQVEVQIRWPGNDYHSQIVKAEWCDLCLSEMKIQRVRPKEQKTEDLPNLEQIVRQIVREEVANGD